MLILWDFDLCSENPFRSIVRQGGARYFFGSLQVCGKIDRASGSDSARFAPTTISVPSVRPSPETSVTTPSERPISTCIGLTKSPWRIQRTPVGRRRRASSAAGFAVRRCVAEAPAQSSRASGTTSCARGCQRSAALGTSKTSLSLLDLELESRRQIGQEPAAGVVDRDDHRVCDDVLRHARVQSDLRDLALERLARKGTDRETHLLALVDRADVGLVDRRPDLQAAQVLGDQEEAGAFRLATTVWPMLMRRSRMIPLTGDRIVVYPRLTVASSRSAFGHAEARSR